MRKNFVILLIIGMILILGSALVVADEDDNHNEENEHDELSLYDWIGHAILSVIGFIFGIIILLTGGSVKGRFKKPKIGNILKLHKINSILFTIIVIFTFFYGLWITSRHEDAVLLTSFHGIIGLTILIFSILSLILSPCISKKKIGSKIHSTLGYIMVILLFIQLILGIQNVI